MSDQLDQVLSRIPWPPILYLAAAAISVFLSYAVPLPWLGSPLSDILFAIGWLLAAAGILLYIAAIRALSRADTTRDPTKPASHLVTKGPYAFSRNPIYLGATAVMFAIAMIAGLPWFFVLAIIAAFATQKLAIEPEEKHLELRFGRHYRDYKKKARRWF